MNAELITAIEDLCKERSLDPEIVYTAIEDSLVSAYRREFDVKDTDNVHASIDRDTGEMAVFMDREVVEDEDFVDDNSQLALSDAQAMDESFEVGDVLQFQLEPKDFGRLAAQAAKSAINQSLVNAERELIHDEFSNRIGDIAYGTVQRADYRKVIVDIGRAEAILSGRDRSSADTYEFGEKMQFLITDVDTNHGRPVIHVSRSHPKLVAKLFEKEVPEIQTGVVEIVDIAREAGTRTKMSVISNDENVDALGAAVGQRGMRAQNVSDELRGEKIDIVEWDPDETVYIRNALKPANVLRVELVETADSKDATVVVPDSQLSLAIGKRGQNARLAAKLTSWKIDIKSESDARAELEKNFMENFNVADDEDAEATAEAEDTEEVNAEASSVEANEDLSNLSADELASELLSAASESEEDEEDETEEVDTAEEAETDTAEEGAEADLSEVEDVETAESSSEENTEA